MPHRLVVLMVLLFHLVSHAQIDQKKLDSLRRSIDSSVTAHKLWQDSFAKAQDSMYEDAIKKTVDSKKDSLDQRQKEVESQRTMQGLVIALVIVIAVVLLLLNRRKKST